MNAVWLSRDGACSHRELFRLSRGRYDEHRAARLAENLLRHAAQEHSPDTGSTVRPRYDHLGCEPARIVDDLTRRDALQSGGDALDARRAHLCSEVGQSAFDAFEHL